MSITSATAGGPSPRQDILITALFDAITSTNCLTHAEISVAAGISVSEVDEALTLIRHPDIAAMYGWTVPHVRRGRPREGQEYRYIVVGLSGEVLNDDDIRIVREGALSTTNTVSSEARNLANGLRLSRPMVQSRAFQRWAGNTATILEGIAVQAEIEAERIRQSL